MTDFTPGPWFIGEAKRSSVTMGQTVIQDTNKRWIALTHIFGRQEEAEANAHLIAAAPDLLNACKAMQDLLTQMSERIDWGKTFLDAKTIRLMNDVPIEARRAIEKARGAE